MLIVIRHSNHKCFVLRAGKEAKSLFHLIFSQFICVLTDFECTDLNDPNSYSFDWMDTDKITKEYVPWFTTARSVFSIIWLLLQKSRWHHSSLYWQEVWPCVVLFILQVQCTFSNIVCSLDSGWLGRGVKHHKPDWMNCYRLIGQPTSWLVEWREIIHWRNNKWINIQFVILFFFGWEEILLLWSIIEH